MHNSPVYDKLFDVKAEWKSQVPIPVFDAHPEFNELYWKAWELAHGHLLDLPGMPQTPYMDEAFCDTEIWIWDTCFMALFCKYAQNRFPGVESLNNFYEVLYGNKRLPQIITRNAPTWTGYKIGQEVPVSIHIFDNPPLFAWAELENARFSGDREHIRKLLLEKQYLQRHFDRLEELTQPMRIASVSSETCLVKHQYGYFWEGGRSGMDNTPRGRTGARAIGDRPDNPKMLWVDAIAQQGLAAACIAELADYIDEKILATEWRQRHEKLKNTVNRYYWDNDDAFYYDLHADTLESMKVMTPASFWPLMSRMSSPAQVAGMVRHVLDPRKFGGAVPLVSLARDDADFNGETGAYWRGSLWVPTAYMTIKGLTNYGYFDMASEAALKILNHMVRTYREYEPHTIWECYNPNRHQPARSCDENCRIVRSDFCGWSALAPIGLYLENVIGIHAADAFHNIVQWRPQTESAGAIGVKNFHFGTVVTDMIYTNSKIMVNSNQAYILKFKDLTLAVKTGENCFKI